MSEIGEALIAAENLMGPPSQDSQDETLDAPPLRIACAGVLMREGRPCFLDGNGVALLKTKIETHLGPTWTDRQNTVRALFADLDTHNRSLFFRSNVAFVAQVAQEQFAATRDLACLP